MTDTDKKNDIQKILKALSVAYPQAKCALSHHDPLELLVATILSAQCTDQRVNIVTKELFRKYRSAKDYARANIETFENEIRSTGFFHNKAKNIIACAKALLEKHGGIVPNNMDALTALPGVGRKTANVVLGAAFGIASGVVVDTHVRRLAQRMGLSKNDDPEKIEADLMKIVPEKSWIDFSHLLIWHGRNRCQARKPDCMNCEIKHFCPRIGVRE